MADNDNAQVFDATINYESSGYDASLQEAEALDEVRLRLAEGAVVNFDVAVTGDEALAQLSELDGETFSPSVDPTYDDSNLSELDTLDTANFTPNVEPQLDDGELKPLEELDGETLTPGVEPQLEDSNIKPLEELDGETITPGVDPQPTDEGKDLLTRLHELGINPIQIVMNVAGTILDVLGKLEGIALDPFLGADEAGAKFSGRTGLSSEGIGDSIRGVLADDLGDSPEQVGDLYTAAAQLGEPFEEATRQSLLFTHTFDDQNPLEVLKTLHELVGQGLVGSLEEGTDLLVKFFQEGGNKGGDALATIQNYASSWKDAGLNGEEALGFINSGLDGGIESANKGAIALQTFNDTLTLAAENPTSDQAKFLKSIGLENPKEQGESAGAEYIEAFIAKVKEQSPEQQEIGFGDFFGKGGKKYTSAIAGLDSDSLGKYSEYVDAAEEAAAKVDDSLRGVLDDFTLAINTKVQELLSSDAIDLPGKITALKTGLQDAIDTLVSGGTLEDALTVGLKPIGFDDEFLKLQAIFGDLLIGMLQIVAGIQDVTGHGGEAQATRAEVVRLSEQQLAYSLKIDNPEEFSSDIQTAVDRGVNPKGIYDAVGTAVTELVNTGAVGQAQALLDNVKNGSATLTNVTDKFFGQAFPDVEIPISPEMSPEEAQAFIEQTKKDFDAQGFNFEAEVTPTIPPLLLETYQQQIDDATQAAAAEAQKRAPRADVGFGAMGGNNVDAPKTYASIAGDDLSSGLDAAAASYKETSDQAAYYTTQAGMVELANTEAGQSFIDMIANAQQLSEDVESGAKTMSDAMQEAGDSTSVSLDKAGGAAEKADAAITEAISGNTIIKEFEAMSASAIENSDLTIEALERINNVSLRPIESHVDSLSSKVLNLANTVAAAAAAIAKAATGAASLPSVGGGNTTTVNINQTNNVQSNAQAAAVGITNNELRGFS